MDDYRKLVYRCNGLGTISAAQRELIVLLPPAERPRFNRVFQQYLQTYGPHGFAERMNDRTVGSILDEADSLHVRSPIESGGRDGVRYRLFGPSSTDRPTQAGPPPDLLDDDPGR